MSEHEEFEKLVSRYLDEDLGEDEVAAFAEALSADAGKLDLFVDRARMEAHLQRHGETVAAMDAEERERMWGAGNRGAMLCSVLAAAAVLVFGAVLLYFIQVPEEPAFATWRTSPHATVMVSGQEGDVPQGVLRKGAALAVTQGVAELFLEEGVRCLVQAPGRIVLEDTGRVRLLEGVARFHVEERAHGFRVMVNSLEVVDLGTEFGVDLSMPKHPQVHVLTGEVELRNTVRKPDGTTEEERTRVQAGEAMVREVGLKSIPLDAKRFPGELPTGIPALRFSFDARSGDVLPATGVLAERAGAHLSLDHASAPAVVPGRFGSGLSFAGENRYGQTNWMGIGGTQIRTISLWIRIPENAGGGGQALLGYGAWIGSDRMSNLGLRLSGGENGATLRVVSGRRWLQAVTPLDDGEWHHVVVCMGNYSRQSWPETKIFIDGVAEEWTARLPDDQDAAPLDTFFTDVHGYHATPLIFGRMGDPDERPYLPYYQGEMDEVIVAGGLLTESQVQALHEGRLEDSGLDLGE